MHFIRWAAVAATSAMLVAGSAFAADRATPDEAKALVEKGAAHLKVIDDRSTEFDGGELDRERYGRRMIERILTQYEELGVTFASADLEYLLTKMNQVPMRPADRP